MRHFPPTHCAHARPGMGRARLLPLLLASALALSGCSTIGNWFGRGDNLSNAATTGELVPNLTLSPQAAQDYAGAYRADPGNKAFAMSPSGAYGVAFGAATISEAERGALEKCMQDVRPGDLECAVYDVNGRVAFRAPVRLRRVQ